MTTSRRGFLGIAGGVLVGSVPVASVLARGNHVEPAPSALKGKKWAMVINVKKCLDKENCNACQEACHAAHNVPNIEGAKEEIKWIWREGYPHAFPNQCHEYTAETLKNGNVPILCNHCENPGCARVCPTQATWKREDGVVMMDMHRCIGCRYCMAGCPYGARSFNWKDPRPFIKDLNKDFPSRMKGVVEKCNFCAERLAIGEIPLCVEACKNADCGALVFGDLADPKSEIAELLRNSNAIRRKPELGTAPQVFYIV
ncbi:MAG: 4Fe-4S dicluster domain-containing protein [Deltaproteobacteria bacterium]|nr:4Fe-4S dicluster domain-containing protein [Deltaproteobacteria bacterium]